MKPSPLLDPQLLDAIQWSEPEAGTLAYRYPMLDMEIPVGAKLAVRESEMTLFVDQERGADILGPGMYALNAANLPLLAGVKSWPRGFDSSFKSDIYFFSAGDVIGQRWGTTMPISLHDTESGATRIRGYGSYSYRIVDVRTFFAHVSGTRESFFVYDLDDRLRKTIVAGMKNAFSANGQSSADVTAVVAVPSDTLVEHIRPAFAALGLELTQFSMEALLLEDEWQSSVDERMGMSLAGNLKTTDAPKSCGGCGASMRPDHGALKCDYCHAVLVVDAGDDEAGVSAEFEGHICPACEIPLMQATVGGASLLYCTRCDGMLVAMDEFESLVAASRALAGGPVPAAEAKPAGMQHSVACPECDGAMEAQLFGGAEISVIDGCESCGLYWLDHGTLARIAHGAVAGSGAEGPYFNPAQVDSSARLNMSL